MQLYFTNQIIQIICRYSLPPLYFYKPELLYQRSRMHLSSSVERTADLRSSCQNLIYKVISESLKTSILFFVLNITFNLK
jgi:hypothetical protein